MTNPGLRCIRDLRGEHLPMLEEMHRACVEAIQREYKVGEEDIMVFANYPPSVYRLHFHFCAPFFQPSAYDAFRMHSLSAIMNNLRIREDYYAASAFQIPVHLHSELFRVFVQPKGGTPSPSGSDEETRECVA
jgi:m7GpppX diphosphatase